MLWTTGLLLLPGGLLMGLLAPTVGRLYDRHGPTALLVIGAVVVSAVLWSMTMFDENSPFWWVLVAHIVLSFGLALLFTPLFTSGLASLRPELYSHGSAVVGTIQQLAGAAGIAAVHHGHVVPGRTRSWPRGFARSQATAAGIHAAFIYGAVISLLAIPAAFVIRRPAQADAIEGVPVGH